MIRMLSTVELEAYCNIYSYIRTYIVSTFGGALGLGGRCSEAVISRLLTLKLIPFCTPISPMSLPVV